MENSGEEKYSKEAYENEEKNLKIAEEWFEEKKAFFEGLREEAEEKLARLLASGQEEATALNEEYERLVAEYYRLDAEARKAAQALMDFGHGKLGIKYRPRYAHG